MPRADSWKPPCSHTGTCLVIHIHTSLFMYTYASFHVYKRLFSCIHTSLFMYTYVSFDVALIPRQPTHPPSEHMSCHTHTSHLVYPPLCSHISIYPLISRIYGSLFVSRSLFISRSPFISRSLFVSRSRLDTRTCVFPYIRTSHLVYTRLSSYLSIHLLIRRICMSLFISRSLLNSRTCLFSYIHISFGTDTSFFVHLYKSVYWTRLWVSFRI